MPQYSIYMKKQEAISGNHNLGTWMIMYSESQFAEYNNNQYVVDKSSENPLDTIIQYHGIRINK